MTQPASRTVRAPVAPVTNGAPVPPEDARGEHGASQAAQFLGRIAELVERLAGELRGLLELREIQLAAGAETSVMDAVPERLSSTLREQEHGLASSMLSARDLAAKLGVDVTTVRRWRRDRKLPPAIGLGGVVRWRADVIDRWLAEREEAAS